MTSTTTITDRLFAALDSDAIEVRSRCTGIGRRYQAAVTSALTRRAEGWEILGTRAADVAWANNAGQWSARAYAIRLTADGRGRIAVSSATDPGDLTVFVLDPEDAAAVSRRIGEVDIYRGALELLDAADDDPNRAVVTSSDEIHGDTLLWRGMLLDPSGVDRRPDYGCRAGRGHCGDCAEHRHDGHVRVAMPSDRIRDGLAMPGYVRVGGTVIGEALPGDAAVALLARAGVTLVGSPVRGLGWGEVVDQAAYDAALAGALLTPPVEEPAPPVEEPLAEWERELLEGQAAALAETQTDA